MMIEVRGAMELFLLCRQCAANSNCCVSVWLLDHRRCWLGMDSHRGCWPGRGSQKRGWWGGRSENTRAHKTIAVCLSTTNHDGHSDTGASGASEWNGTDGTDGTLSSWWLMYAFGCCCWCAVCCCVGLLECVCVCVCLPNVCRVYLFACGFCAVCAKQRPSNAVVVVRLRCLCECVCVWFVPCVFATLLNRNAIRNI